MEWLNRLLMYILILDWRGILLLALVAAVSSVLCYVRGFSKGHLKGYEEGTAHVWEALRQRDLHIKNKEIRKGRQEWKR